MITKIITIYFLLSIPVIAFCQIKDSKAYLKFHVSQNENMHYTLKVFPAHQDNIFKIELVKLDSTGNEEILSTPLINLTTILYKKGYQMESGKVYESIYVAVKENDQWKDDYFDIDNCPESTYFESRIILNKNGVYIIRVFNQMNLFFEEKIVI